MTLLYYKRKFYQANMPNPQMWYLLRNDLQKIQVIGFAKYKLANTYNQGPQSTVQRSLTIARAALEAAVVDKYDAYRQSDWNALTLRQAIALHQWLRNKNKTTRPNNVWQVIESLDVSLLTTTEEPTPFQLTRHNVKCMVEADRLVTYLMRVDLNDGTQLNVVVSNFSVKPRLSLSIRFA